MSTGKDNEMWQRIEDAFTPNSDEFKRTERELAKVKLEQDDRLRDDGKPTTQIVVRRHPRWQRVSAIAGVTTLTLALIGWTGSEYVWPKRSVNVFSEPFRIAEQRATSSDATQSDWRLGTNYMSGGHSSAVEYLRMIASENNAVGRAAEAALKRFGNGAIEVEFTDQRSVELLAIEALYSTDEDVRVLAIQQLEAFLVEAERVMRSCDESTVERARSKAITLARMDKRRQQARDGTLPLKPRPPQEAGKRHRPVKTIEIPIPEEFRTPK